MEIIIREPRVDDIDDLLKLISDSTDGKTQLTAAKLKESLFETIHTKRAEAANNDGVIDFSHNDMGHQEPVAYVLLAETNGSLVGFLLSCYYWTPWVGRCRKIISIFVDPSYRLRGIARRLIGQLEQKSIEDNLVQTMFDVGNLNHDLREKLKAKGAFWIRNNHIDWSVCRVNFK